MTTYVMIARVPEGGLAAFDAYEAAVLPLLADHGGRLERRLRSVDGGTEIHTVSFTDPAGLDAYRADPRRAAAAHLLAESGAAVELLQVGDIG
ncbi:hypothetical protein [Actinokineospora sp. HUAS TT18]|uniref:hypothetical protein n=1 Tax=Actinokineospora sp. HUAS TT18 TaxID=3447451 RepID=UPI003F51B6C3